MQDAKDALELNIKGIKCDVCDYVDMNVKLEDYEKWVKQTMPLMWGKLID